LFFFQCLNLSALLSVVDCCAQLRCETNIGNIIHSLLELERVFRQEMLEVSSPVSHHSYCLEDLFSFGSGWVDICMHLENECKSYYYSLKVIIIKKR